ncbi:ferrous iron transport protein B [Paenibacillus konkukensis]|uniref:Ferrous iron transport protein B n=1 Tax=Paenibacillus konkukensis TaxID=2020716 RepID=A0ABY4RSH0_9BACL|nr:nucleoside recognition domain-containing protein [Paenibacillus konkukensis]UQZ85521.1 ferrous iron transport protein B [Paenibacillus konkukensis]
MRATHAAVELPLLLEAVKAEGKRAVLVLTFADKMSADLTEVARYYGDWLGIPVRMADARRLTEAGRTELLMSLALAKPIRPKAKALLKADFPALRPQSTWFEHPVWGRPLSLAMTLLLFAAPVLLAYVLSAWLQPIADRSIIDPIRSWLEGVPPLLRPFFVGDYGIVTLGLYSFLWAFPVVLLLGVSVALAEESGIKDRITDSLDGWMRRIGLSGRDLIPVLSGFGCNVVAVFQSRLQRLHPQILRIADCVRFRLQLPDRRFLIGVRIGRPPMAVCAVCSRRRFGRGAAYAVMASRIGPAGYSGVRDQNLSAKAGNTRRKLAGAHRD